MIKFLSQVRQEIATRPGAVSVMKILIVDQSVRNLVMLKQLTKDEIMEEINDFE